MSSARGCNKDENVRMDEIMYRWLVCFPRKRKKLIVEWRSDPSSFVRMSSCPFFSIAFDPHGKSLTTLFSILIIEISCDATFFVNSQTFDCIIRRWLRSRRWTCWPSIFFTFVVTASCAFDFWCLTSWHYDILAFRNSEMYILEGVFFVAVAICWQSGWWGIQLCACSYLWAGVENMWRVRVTEMATTVPATSYARDYNLPWVEKYRPHKVCDIVGNQDVVARLQVIAQGGNMPNLIFSVSSIRCCLYARIGLALHCCFAQEF